MHPSKAGMLYWYWHQEFQFLVNKGLGVDSIKRFHLTSMWNPIVEIRRSYDRLISTMGFPILVRRHLYIELGPRRLFTCRRGVLLLDCWTADSHSLWVLCWSKGEAHKSFVVEQDIFWYGLIIYKVLTVMVQSELCTPREVLHLNSWLWFTDDHKPSLLDFPERRGQGMPRVWAGHDLIKDCHVFLLPVTIYSKAIYSMGTPMALVIVLLHCLCAILVTEMWRRHWDRYHL